MTDNLQLSVLFDTSAEGVHAMLVINWDSRLHAPLRVIEVHSERSRSRVWSTAPAGLHATVEENKDLASTTRATREQCKKKPLNKGGKSLKGPIGWKGNIYDELAETQSSQITQSSSQSVHPQCPCLSSNFRLKTCKASSSRLEPTSAFSVI